MIFYLFFFKLGQDDLGDCRYSGGLKAGLSLLPLETLGAELKANRH